MFARRRWFKVFAVFLLTTTAAATGEERELVGVQGHVGCRDNPQVVDRLEIRRPGVYENFRVDGRWGSGNRVKITANDVTLRNCDIFNCAGNGVGVFASNVVIENCRIHHCLRGSFKKQEDAHGITGRWGNVIVRNCEIYQVSGDAIQFDPDRRASGKLTIEQCTLWTAPLSEGFGDFNKGERPGENAVDTKTTADERCELVVRNCHLHGWNQPAAISNAAALNLKENVDASVTHCVLSDNEIALRVRGPGSRGGAHVAIADCAIYDTKVGVRAEDKIEQLKITRLAVGDNVGARIVFVGGKPSKGFGDVGAHAAPALAELLKSGFPHASDE